MRQLPVEKYIEHSSVLLLLPFSNVSYRNSIVCNLLASPLNASTFLENLTVPTVCSLHVRLIVRAWLFVSLSLSRSLETWRWRLCERNIGVYSRLAELPTVAGIMLDKGAVQEWNFLTETIKRRYPRNRIAATSVSFLANKTESVLAPVCCIPLVKYRNFLSVAPLFDTGLARFLSLIPYTDTRGHAVKTGGGGGLNVNQVVNMYVHIHQLEEEEERKRNFKAKRTLYHEETLSEIPSLSLCFLFVLLRYILE